MYFDRHGLPVSCLKEQRHAATRTRGLKHPQRRPNEPIAHLQTYIALFSLVQASLPDETPTPPLTTSYLSRPLKGKSALTSAFHLVWPLAHEREAEGDKQRKRAKKCCWACNLARGVERLALSVERLRGLHITAPPLEANQLLQLSLICLRAILSTQPFFHHSKSSQRLAQPFSRFTLQCRRTVHTDTEQCSHLDMFQRLPTAQAMPQTENLTLTGG